MLKLRQVYRLARADENIARTNAGMPVAEFRDAGGENYYELLIAQRQLIVAEANVSEVQNNLLLTRSTPSSEATSGQNQKVIDVAKTLAAANAHVKGLSASLNEKIGWPPDTELELLRPPTLTFEDISLRQATEQAMAANPEIIEAEQNVGKARAASSSDWRNSTMFPIFAVPEGYAYQNNANPLLPRDFWFIGIVGSYILFDFGKRDAQVGMAEAALQLTKPKWSQASSRATSG